MRRHKPGEPKSVERTVRRKREEAMTVNAMQLYGSLRRRHAMILETLLVLLLGLTTSAFAQNSSSGAVLGTVTDPTGAVVVKAGVTLTNTATNATVQQLT